LLRIDSSQNACHSDDLKINKKIMANGNSSLPRKMNATNKSPNEKMIGTAEVSPATPKPKNRIYVFGVAIFLTIITVLIRQACAVTFGERPLLILFMFPIIVTALLGGLFPGLFATFLVAAVADYFFIPPIDNFWISAGHDALQLGMLIANGVLVSIMSEFLRRSRQREYLHWRELAETQRELQKVEIRAEKNLAEIQSALLKHEVEARLVAIGRMEDAIAARKNAEAAEIALQESEQRYRILFEGAADGILVADAQTQTFRYANPAICHMLGYSLDELLQLSVEDIHPKESLEKVSQTFDSQARGVITIATDMPCLRKDGVVIHVNINTSMVNIDNQPCLVGFFTDITDRVRLEAEKENLETLLQQAQRMESIGRLAGGVAHDYNNMLSVISGFAELALDKAKPNDPIREDLKEIVSAANRSKDITRQLLAFARRQDIQPKVLDLNETVEGMLKMLRRLIGEDMELAWFPGTQLWPIHMDPSQIDQVLANLCVNARDAIHGVGKITIETRNIVINETMCTSHPKFSPGSYVKLIVSDNGSGIDKEILDKIFEPFFTTKEQGKGTGLGLSTVYGIIDQNDGVIDVHSEPGKGTSFNIYFPRRYSVGGDTSEEKTVTPQESRGETLLVVEDEIAILKLITTILSRLGYIVLTAKSPSEALSQVKEYPNKIDLLLTDVVMPEMNGKELADQLQVLRPSIKCLFMSGYTRDIFANQGIPDEGVHFLKKPFSTNTLAESVRNILDSVHP
jgi:PAS domain S-box-containing protein